MSQPYNIALIGCGTVGSGVARLLLEQPQRLAARAGRPLVLRRVVVKHEGNEWTATPQWTSNDLKPFFSDFVQAGDYLSTMLKRDDLSLGVILIGVVVAFLTGPGSRKATERT